MASKPTDFASLSEELAEVETESRFQKKLNESPFMVAGLAIGTSVAAYGFWNIRRSKMRVSLYLMQLRVVAQGGIVMLLVGGACVQLYGNLKKMYFGDAIEEKKK